MNESLNNPITQGVIVTIICALIFWLVGWVRFKIDEKTIFNILVKSKAETEYTFRGEPYISSESNLSEDRVHKVCAKSKKITRNKNEKKSWRLEK